jgi:hypothetical protein
MPGTLVRLAPNAFPNALGLTRCRTHTPAQRTPARAAGAPWVHSQWRSDAEFFRYAVSCRQTSKPGASRSTVKQPAAGIEPAAGWQAPRGELAAPIQHNGLLLEVAPVARQARLVSPPLSPPALARALAAPFGFKQHTLCLAPRVACNTMARAREARMSTACAPAARGPRIQCPPTPRHARASGSPSSPPALARRSLALAWHARSGELRAAVAALAAGARRIGSRRQTSYSASTYSG